MSWLLASNYLEAGRISLLVGEQAALQPKMDGRARFGPGWKLLVLICPRFTSSPSATTVKAYQPSRTTWTGWSWVRSAARQRGTRGGHAGSQIRRPKVLDESQMALAQRMHASGEPASTIAATLGVSRAGLSRAHQTS